MVYVKKNNLSFQSSFNLFTTSGLYCCQNQFTDFYMMGTLAVNGLTVPFKMRVGDRLPISLLILGELKRIN